MKVLLISNGFQPNYEKAFANGLAANGMNVVLIASDRTLVSELVQGVVALNLRGSQDPKRGRLEKARNILRYVWALIRQMRVGHYDAVHLTGLFMTRNVMAGCVEWIGYRFLAHRFFMTVHNILPHGRHGRWYHALHWLIYRLPDRLVVHTNKMKSALSEDFGIDPKRVVVMPHGVDTVPDSLVVPEPSETLRLLVFGGLNRYKGVDVLLDALVLCPDIPVKVTLVGEARDAAYAQEIASRISGLPAQHVLEWRRGFIPEAEVQPYFEAVDAVVLPYRHIDQSGVLFTAFRFGVPVIATDVGAFRECLPDYAGLLVERSTPAMLAEAIRNFYVRRMSFDRARIRGHAETLAWPVAVKPLITAYREVAA